MEKTLKQLLHDSPLTEIAIQSNIHYGTKIFQRGGVELIASDTNGVEAWAGGLVGDVKSGGGSRRHVWLSVKQGKLFWHCSGNPKNHDIFCKHCVAVALKVGSNEN
ncbi:MAG: hypothetical protein ABI758_00495 [Candidatus Woesebacteria bacterium]